MKLRQRLFLWYGGVLFVMSAVLVVAVYLVVAHKLRVEFGQFLSDEYWEAVQITNRHIGELNDLKQAVKLEVGGVRYFYFVYRLYDVDKAKFLLDLSSKEEWLKSLPAVRTPRNELERSVVLLGEEGPRRENRNELHFLTGWPDREKHPNLLLSVGLCYDRVWHRLGSLRDNLFLAFIITTALASLGGHLLASRGLKPIHSIANSLEDVSASNLSYRLPEPEVNDEIGRIILSVNSMLHRLETAFQHLREFTADAAHELRTPLTAAKCRVDVALERQRENEEYEEAFRDVLDRLTGLENLVDQLLLLANLDARPDDHKREQVNIQALLADISGFFEIAAEHKAVDFSLDCAERCDITGNPALLRRLFSNLIENAIRHTPAGGAVRVQTSCTDGGCNIAVTDTGSGLDSGHLAKVFQRFYRADGARTWGKGGSGLGLSICQKIVEVHEGSIQAHSEKGKGTSFSVHLPRRHEGPATNSSSSS